MPDSKLIRAARDLRELIESEADEIEATCTVSRPVVDAIESAGLFLLSTPSEVGGLEADVDTVIGVCEELSYADGATGWAIGQNTITGSYLSYIDPAFAATFAARGAGAVVPMTAALSAARWTRTVVCWCAQLGVRLATRQNQTL